MGPPRPDDEDGVYGISVAAEMVGMGVQRLRLYEARGLLQPERTAGGTRRYSANDLDRLRRIGDLLDAGLNLAGIGMVLDLEAENTDLREQPTAVSGSVADPLMEVAARVYADFAEQASLADVLAVVERCSADLDAPSVEALPELVERLARQRLATGVHRDRHRGEPSSD